VEAEVAAEAVAGAAGHEAEDGAAADEGAGDLVEGAVAADGDDEAAAVGKGAGGEGLGVARVLREREIGAAGGGVGADGGEEAGGGAGDGVEDEARFQGADSFLTGAGADGTDRNSR